ncbi:MAG: methyltransferase domain-containing protein [Pseudomonadota bacterium]
MPDLFDMKLRALRRERARRIGPELFLHGRAFTDCLERIASLDRRFGRALLIGSFAPDWPAPLGELADSVEIFGEDQVEDAWAPRAGAYDLIVAVGTLDTINGLPLALRLLREALAPGGLLIGAMSGANTLPQLRSAMRAADAVSGGASPHVHPRIEPAAVAPLLEQAGFVRPVIDVDRVAVSYGSLDRLVADLRAMAATNLLVDRPRFIGKAARTSAEAVFAAAGEDGRTVESFEIIHFAAWAAEG